MLIIGETGTGKERLARGIHENSPRASQPFVVVDCTVIPEALIESHLFGHEKGAFTGADRGRTGLVQLAHRGTLFFDEVGDLPLPAQAKLLRVLQEKKFRPVGGKGELYSDFRTVAATHRNLEEMVKEGRFREDLFFRLSALIVRVPPLRARRDDILPTVQDVLRQEAQRTGGELKGLAPDFLETVLNYSWPGNVRELIHATLHAVAMSGGSPTLYAVHLPEGIRFHAVVERLARRTSPSSTEAPSRCGQEMPGPEVLDDALSEKEFPTYKAYREQVGLLAARRYLDELMKRSGGNIAQACTLSGLSRSRLYALMKEADYTTKPMPTRAEA